MSMTKVKISNMAYPNKHIDIEITYCSRDHVIVDKHVVLLTILMEH